MSVSNTEEWSSKKKILVVLAHPDDPEFFCGGTLAHWVKCGHEVHYCLITNGNKGSDDPEMTPDKLSKLREVEQRKAADVIGVGDIINLGYDDGMLIADLKIRKDVVRVIRKVKPDILVSCDPLNFFPNENYINHPDHRTAGQIALDAVFPASGNRMFFPELITDEGLGPHSVEEVWLSLTAQPNFIMDITGTFEIKLKALHEHKSQIGEPEAFDKRMRTTRRTKGSTEEDPVYEETFKRIVFRK
ncbi:GlcNAc-PI de-N-acetylase [Leptolinea sp. HRD-7]|nr:GlcNAc-PI de-N-acetylase [Leptolinea sp. HRD-7]